MKTRLNVKYFTVAVSNLSVRRNIFLPHKRTAIGSTSWESIVFPRPLTGISCNFQPHRFSHVSTSSKESVPSKSAASVKDYFNILGVERSFSISQHELKTKYKILMSKLHPDVQHSRVPGKTSSPINATDVTRGYDVLKNPYSRALHLLELVNSTDVTNTNMDQEFYKHVMDLREEIETARLEEDVKRLLDQNMERKTDVIQQLNQAFSNQNYSHAQRLVAELKYWETCEEILRGKA